MFREWMELEQLMAEMEQSSREAGCRIKERARMAREEIARMQRESLDRGDARERWRVSGIDFRQAMTSASGSRYSNK
jgi:hypothetical protein